MELPPFSPPASGGNVCVGDGKSESACKLEKRSSSLASTSDAQKTHLKMEGGEVGADEFPLPECGSDGGGAGSGEAQ